MIMAMVLYTVQYITVMYRTVSTVVQYSMISRVFRGAGVAMCAILLYYMYIP